MNVEATLTKLPVVLMVCSDRVPSPMLSRFSALSGFLATNLSEHSVSCFTDCLYGNRCLANRAGWASAECKPVSCPESSAGSVCTLEYDPIVCNSRLVSAGITCAYSNACLASEAGYTTDSYAGQCIYPSLITPTRSVSFDATAVGDVTAAPTTASAAPVKTIAFASALAMAVSALVM